MSKINVDYIDDDFDVDDLFKQLYKVAATLEDQAYQANKPQGTYGDTLDIWEAVDETGKPSETPMHVFSGKIYFSRHEWGRVNSLSVSAKGDSFNETIQADPLDFAVETMADKLYKYLLDEMQALETAAED